MSLFQLAVVCSVALTIMVCSESGCGRQDADGFNSCDSSVSQGFCGTGSGCCGEGNVLLCNSSITPSISTSDSGIVVCGPAVNRIWCKNYGYVVASRLSGGILCLKCRPAGSLRLLIDACPWRASLCRQDEVLAGVALFPFSQKCCLLQFDGCAPAARWLINSKCPRGTAVSAVAGKKVPPCLGYASQNSWNTRFCSGLFFTEPEETLANCTSLSRCGKNSLVVDSTECGGSGRLTQARCATLRSGRVDETNCISVFSESAAWCPSGFKVVGVCAPPQENGCAGEHTTVIECCRVELLYNTAPCTKEHSFFPAAGAESVVCTLDQWAGGSLSDAPLHNVSAMTFEPGRNYLEVFGGSVRAGELSLISIPVEQFGAVGIRVESVTAVGPAGIEAVSENMFIVAEKAGHSLQKLQLLASGKAWNKQIFLGRAGRTGTLGNMSFLTAACGPIHSVVYDSSRNMIFFSSQNAVFRIDDRQILMFIGGSENGLDLDEVFRTELRLLAPTALTFTTMYGGLLFVFDSGQHSLFAVNVSSGEAVRILGPRGVSGNDRCLGAGGLAMLRNLRVGNITGLAFHDVEGALFVTDTSSHCVRKLFSFSTSMKDSLAGCKEVGGFNCGAITAGPAVQHLDKIFFEPTHIALSNTVLYVSCVGCQTIYGLLLVEEIKSAFSTTQTPKATTSLSSTMLTTPSRETTRSKTLSSFSNSFSVSSSTCEGLPTQAYLANLDGSQQTQNAIDIQYRGILLKVVLTSCHRWNTTRNLTLPTYSFDPKYHPGGTKISEYGFSRIGKYGIEDFIQAWFDNGTVMLKIGPSVKYHPTIAEHVLFHWEAEAFYYAREHLDVPLHVFAPKKSLFNSFFEKFISYSTFLFAVISIVTVSPTTTVRVARLLFILSVSECPNEDYSLPLPFSFHPVGIAIGEGDHRYYVGAAFCNTGLILTACFLHLLSALFANWCVNSKSTRPFINALSFMHFPSLSFAPIMILLQPTLTSALTVAYYGTDQEGERGERTAASIIVVGIFWMAGFIIYLLTPARFQAVARHSTSLNVRRLRFVGPLKWLDKQDSSKGFVRRYGSLFQECTSHQPYFFIVEIGFAIVLGIVDSFPLINSTRCNATQTVMAVMFISYMALLFLFKPFQSNIRQSLCLLASAFDTAAIVVLAFSVESMMDVFEWVAGAFVCMSAVTIYFLSALNIYIYFTFGLNSMKKWWKGRRPVEDHEVIAVILSSGTSEAKSELISDYRLLGHIPLLSLPAPETYARDRSTPRSEHKAFNAYVPPPIAPTVEESTSDDEPQEERLPSLDDVIATAKEELKENPLSKKNRDQMLLDMI